MGYDANSRLTHEYYSGLNISYQYDDAGNRTKRTMTDGGGPDPYTNTNTMTYGAGNREANAVTVTLTPEAAAYPPARLTQPEAPDDNQPTDADAEQAAWDALAETPFAMSDAPESRMLRAMMNYPEPSPAETAMWTGLSYDFKGNVTTRPPLEGGNSYTYTWDEFDRLKSAARTGQITVNYDYDAGGRLHKRAPGGDTKINY